MFPFRPLPRALLSTCAGVLAILAPLTVSAADTTTLQPRQFAAVAHNTDNHQFLLFGGTNGRDRYSDTWILSSSGWKLQHPVLHPQERISSAVAYDSYRDEYVLFGGRARNTNSTRCYSGAVPVGLATELFCKDTWTFKNNIWSLKMAAAVPPRRERHAMAFDAASRQVVLFGGIGSTSTAPLGDTWVWDGNNWKQVFTAHVPPARFGHTMAYDPINQQVVMFGGDGGSKILNDTWLWNGRDWLPAPPQSTPPQPRTGSAMDYNPTTRKMVLFSGMTWNGRKSGTPSSETWTWEGYQWKKLAPATFQLITDFTKLTPAIASKAIVANGTPTLLWLAR